MRSLPINLRREDAARASQLALGAALGSAGPLVGLANGGFDFAAAAPMTMLGLLIAAILVAVSPLTAPRSAPVLLAVGGLAGLAALLALSLAWSPIVDGGWLVAVKGLAYVAALVLAAIVIRSTPAAVAALAGLAAGTIALSSATVVTIVRAADPTPSFFDERLAGPVGYQNGFAAILFAGGLALLVGAGLRVRGAWGVALRMLASAGLGLVGVVALAAQSRGAVLGVVAGLAVLLALWPGRLRAVPELVGLAVVLTASFGRAGRMREGVLDGPAAAAAAVVDDWAALVLPLVAVMAAIGLVHGLLEWRLREVEAVRTWSRRAAQGVAALAGLAVLAGAILGADDLAAKLRETFDESAEAELATSGERLLSVSSNGRFALWESALGAFADAPVLGQGAGGFAIWWRTNGDVTITDTLFAHSLPLAMAAEAGLAGLLLLIAFVAGVVWALVRVLRARQVRRTVPAVLAAIVAAWLTNASVDWYWSLPAATLPAIVAAGALLGLTAPSAPETPRRSRPPLGRPAQGAVAAVALLLALAGGAFAALPFLADRALDRAAVVGLDDANGSRADIDWAEGVYPHDPRIDQLRARISLGLGDLARARRELVEGTERVPQDHRAWSRLADFDEFVLGDPRGALPSLRRALALHRGDTQLAFRIRQLEEDLEEG